jgi:hypothetical protein
MSASPFLLPLSVSVPHPQQPTGPRTYVPPAFSPTALIFIFQYLYSILKHTQSPRNRYLSLRPHDTWAVVGKRWARSKRKAWSPEVRKGIGCPVFSLLGVGPTQHIYRQRAKEVPNHNYGVTKRDTGPWVDDSEMTNPKIIVFFIYISCRRCRLPDDSKSFEYKY